MNLTQRITAAFAVAALTLSVAPASTQAADSSVRENDKRCEKVSGREKSRCKFVNRRTSRMRRGHQRFGYTRGNTLREQRNIPKTEYRKDIRRRGRENLQRFRKAKQGRARSLISRQVEQAREQCRSLEGTEKYQCIRENMRKARRTRTH